MKRFTLRIERELLDQIKTVAKREKRSVNKQIVVLMRRYSEKLNKGECSIPSDDSIDADRS